jgi:uncharacterized protein (DUF433 family)/transposase-like protein
MRKQAPNTLRNVADAIDLLERPIYGVAQVDRLLGLSPGTARRWIDGYRRGGKGYPPVVRVEPTGDELVTWGEFVETRLLSEYRDAGVSLVRMRPAIDRLREQFHPRYPLAHSRPFLDVAGRELVLRAQEDVGLDRELLLVVVRNDQVVLSQPAEQFIRSAEFDRRTQVVERLRPVAEIGEVVIDPLRQFGEPVVRSVRTEVIAEQVRVGETIDGIAELYDLDRHLVEAALRYELICGAGKELAA